CDLLVHPSYREGLPRVVVQAMLARVPVVATDADGTREVCVPEKTGRLVPIADIEALRSALQHHLDHPHCSRQWAEQAEALVRTQFTEDAMVNALETLYAKLLA
ncbi:MAG: glycosyltransferase, partial [Planctomycetota bacterium]|nr:glycosyltransferase [Planctomycetota bacterium]